MKESEDDKQYRFKTGREVIRYLKAVAKADLERHATPGEKERLMKRIEERRRQLNQSEEES